MVGSWPRRAATSLVACAIALALSGESLGASPLGDPLRGARLYEARCGGCHGLDANRVGPLHRGVYGRRAGSVTGFNYTPALKSSGLVWTSANLDRWLIAPTQMVRGTAMGFRMPDPQERADVIAYLASPAARASPDRPGSKR